MVTVPSLVIDPVESDDESSFEVVDSNSSLEENRDNSLTNSQGVDRISLENEKIETFTLDRLLETLNKQRLEVLEGEVRTHETIIKVEESANEQKLDELKKVHATEISERDDEIHRLSRVNEEQKGEIESFKWKTRILEKLHAQKRGIDEGELRSTKNLMEMKERLAEERMEELKSVHQAEIDEKNAEIDRLSLLVESIKRKVVEELNKRREVKVKINEVETFKQAEIPRKYVNKEDGEFEALEKWSELSVKLDESRIRLEEAYKITDEYLLKMREDNPTEQTSHETEVVRRDEEISRLTRVNEELRREIETLKSQTVELSPSTLRVLSFRKVDGRFGAGHNGTSITAIVKGGPAEEAGLRRGDQLISINGVNVETLPNDEISKLSVNVGDDVTLVVRFNPERLRDLERSTGLSK